MALSNIEKIRVLIQDNGKLPFLDEGDYILANEEIEMFLELQNNDLLQAARMAAYSAALFISTVSIKELYGDVEVWSNASKEYLKALQAFTSDKSLISVIPKGVMPYAAGISVDDIVASLSDPDNPRVYNWLYAKDYVYDRTPTIVYTDPMKILVEPNV